MREVLRQKIADALVTSPPPMTRRDVRLPSVRGKALAVIGMRRSGKTTFLWQCLGDRLAAGAPGQPPQLIQVCLDISDKTTRVIAKSEH
jgi:predicted AAA+ superfamily ATPase